MMRTSRRGLVAGGLAIGIGFTRRTALAQADVPAFSLPIGLPERVPGDGFVIRHGYATENTWYNPGWWHTGEDWYVIGGNAAGAAVYAVAAGKVVFAGSEYPGRVVIVRHDSDLYSMYGHLDHALSVNEGDIVARGQLLGTVFDRTDGAAPSHLHFEMRTFLTTPEVNGNAPRYDVGCGFECPPGPGYWPITAPEHLSTLGWRNPLHVIANRSFAGRPFEGTEVLVATGAPVLVDTWSLPADRSGAERIGTLNLSASERFLLLGIATGTEDSIETGAAGYRLWYRLDLADGPAWVRAVEAFSGDVGSDGRSSSLRMILLPSDESL